MSMAHGKMRHLFLIALGLSIVSHAGVLVSQLIFANKTLQNGRGDGPIEIGFVSEVSPAKTHSHARPVPTRSPSLEVTGELDDAPPAPSEEVVTGGRPGTVYGEDEVDTPVQLLSVPRISYPTAHLRDGIEGDVELYLVVDERGLVTDVEIIRGRGLEFDDAAQRAARNLQFAPAQKDGRAVSVHVHWTCRFRIRG